MPYIKNSFSILAECAAIDLANTRGVVRESEIRSAYESIDEATDEYVVCAEMVPVVQIDNEYYTEASFLAPYMRDNGIKSMMEGLDSICAANNLPPKSIGLLVESDCGVSEMIEKACQSENCEAKEAALQKIGKATDLVKALKDKGYPCKKKNPKRKSNL
jgi:hypothetical protein